MKSLLILWHSATGGARQMAEAAAEGARAEAEVATRLLPAASAGPAELLAADAFVFACPENLAAMTGVMKDFFDRSYYPVLDRLNGRACAYLVCAGTDGTNALRQMRRIGTGWRLREVAEPIILLTGAQTPEAIAAPKRIPPEGLARCAELGAALAAGLAMGIY
jgi:multimeric flavodoxin WrbA